VFAAHLVNRYEFIEDAVVDHHQQAVFRRIVLEAEETFRRVVGFHIMHPVRRDQRLVLVPVRLETDPAVEKYFHIGPDVRQVFASRLLQYRLDQHQHPRGDAGEAVHVGFPGAFDDRLDLAFPFIHQDDLFVGDADQVDERVQVLQQDGRKVSAVRIPVQRGRAVASA